jgi:glutathione S-transferase
MKLYYSPGACSFAVHVALREAGVPFELEKVDLGTKRTERGRDYLEVNPKGYVPALELDGGEILTEAAACLQYVADLAPARDLAPTAGTLARYRLVEWLNFVATELHKTFGPLFHQPSPGRRKAQLELLARRFDYVARSLAAQDYLLGAQFTVADAYLYTVLNWTHFLEIDLGAWPPLRDFLARIARRGSVQEAKQAEHLG